MPHQRGDALGGEHIYQCRDCPGGSADTASTVANPSYCEPGVHALIWEMSSQSTDSFSPFKARFTCLHRIILLRNLSLAREENVHMWESATPEHLDSHWRSKRLMPTNTILSLEHLDNDFEHLVLQCGGDFVTIDVGARTQPCVSG